MPRLPLPESKLARFPFRLLPHFEFAAEELEKTLVWENAFQAEATFPRIELVQSELSELAQESLLVQSSPLSASGEFVLLLPRETILHPSAIFIVQKQIRRGDLDLVYWDETEYVPGTPQSLIRYIRKGRPSALSALGRNMIGGVAVLRKTLWDEVKEESDQKDALLWQLMAEMLGVKSGLGWYLTWAQGWASYPNMYGALLVMALLFSGVITLLFTVRDRVLSWQKGVVQW